MGKIEWGAPLQGKDPVGGTSDRTTLEARVALMPPASKPAMLSEMLMLPRATRWAPLVTSSPPPSDPGAFPDKGYLPGLHTWWLWRGYTWPAS